MADNLDTKFEDFAKNVRMGLETLHDAMVDVRSDLREVKKDTAEISKQTTQANGRLRAVEGKQETLTESFIVYQKDMKILHILATSWKPITAVVIAAAMIFNIIKYFFDALPPLDP